MPTDIVIVSAARTPIATAYKGSLAGVDANTLAQVALGAAVERSGIDAGDFEDIGFGESMQGGGNVGRYAANQLGLTNVPAVATQRWCASGMAGTQWIAANIAAGMIDVGAAGGVESMSTAPATAKFGEPWLPAANLETPDAPPFNTAKELLDLIQVCGSDEAGEFATVVQQDQRRPLPDAKASAEAAPEPGRAGELRGERGAGTVHHLNFLSYATITRLVMSILGLA